MVNYTGLLKGVEAAIAKSNTLIKKTNNKFLVKLSILPGEHPSISDLKRKLIGAKIIALGNALNASAPTRFTPKAMLEINSLIKKAKEFYLTPEWKNKAIKYAGMTDKEAEATAKFLSSNIGRYGVSTIPLAPGKLKGISVHDSVKLSTGVVPPTGVGIIRTTVDGIFRKTPIHEAHHAAMLGKGAFIPSQLGIKDPNVINGMNKFNRHISNLGAELSRGINPKIRFKSPEELRYITSPIEYRSRMLTGLTEKYAPNEIPDVIDTFKKHIDPNVYANVAKKMLVAAPVGIGLATYNQE